MAQEVGVVFQTVPKGVADMIDHYAQAYELSSADMIRLMATTFHMLHGQRDDRVLALVRTVSERAKRERDSALLVLDRAL